MGVNQIVDRIPGETFDPGEKEDIVEVLDSWLNSNDVHEVGTEEFDSMKEMEHYHSLYYRIGKLYYVFSGHDFLCSHGYITNYEGRANG